MHKLESLYYHSIIEHLNHLEVILVLCYINETELNLVDINSYQILSITFA